MSANHATPPDKPASRWPERVLLVAVAAILGAVLARLPGEPEPTDAPVATTPAAPDSTERDNSETDETGLRELVALAMFSKAVALGPPADVLRREVLAELFEAPFERVRGGERPVTVLELDG